MRKQVLGGIVGLLLGALLVTAVPARANDSLYTQALLAIIGSRVELQRIANALDRLVAIQSGATRKDQVERNQ